MSWRPRRPPRRRDPPPVGRHGRIGPIRARHSRRERLCRPVPQVDLHERVRPAAFRHGDRPGAGGTDRRRGQPGACGHPAHRSVRRRDVEIAEDPVAIREVALGKDHLAGGGDVEGSHMVDARHGRGIAAVRPGGDEPRVGAPVRTDVEQRAAVRRHLWVEPHAGTGRQRLRRGGRTVRRGIARLRLRRSPRRVGPGGPLGRQRHAERLLTGGIEAIGRPLPGDRLDERRHAVRTMPLKEIVEEARPVRVAADAARPDRRIPPGLPDRLEAALERRAAQHHFVERAVHASGVSQRRLVPGRDALDDPPGHGKSGKERPAAPEPPEHAARDPPEGTGAVEVEHVRELVDDDQLDPVVGIRQGEVVGGRPGVHRDPVRRPDLGRSVRDVDVVGQQEIDRSGGTREELRGERPVRLLGHIGRVASQVFEMRGERDAKVLRRERPPGLIRRRLGRGRQRKPAQEPPPGGTRVTCPMVPLEPPCHCIATGGLGRVATGGLGRIATGGLGRIASGLERLSRRPRSAPRRCG